MTCMWEVGKESYVCQREGETTVKSSVNTEHKISHVNSKPDNQFYYLYQGKALIS